MEKYYGDYEAKVILQLKVMDFAFFVTVGFQFALASQNLERFMSWIGKWYDSLIKVFYTNMKLDKEDLVSEVMKKKIKIKPDDWIHVTNLKYEGHKFDVTNILNISTLTGIMIFLK